MKHRALRIAWSVTWGIVAVLVIALWVRSSIGPDGYSFSDNITWHYEGPNAIEVATQPGGVMILTFVDRPAPPAIAAALSRPWMIGWFQTIRSTGVKPLWWFDGHFKGAIGHISIPDWFPVLVCCGLGALPWRSTRFSLRTLLIATTLVAGGLGLIVWLAR
jgi:hypothetical protein